MDIDNFSQTIPSSNSHPILPIVFCLDLSSSMYERVQALQRGLQQFIDDIKSDDLTIRAVEGAIITFNSVTEVVQDFAPVVDWKVPQLTVDGESNLVGAVALALELLENKTQNYKHEGRAYYQPWLVILAIDGQFPDDPSGLDWAADRVSKLISQNKLVSFPIGIGDDICWEDLMKFTKDQDSALELKNSGSFLDFFSFFSSSASLTVRSSVLEGYEIDLEAMKKTFNVKSR